MAKNKRRNNDNEQDKEQVKKELKVQPVKKYMFGERLKIDEVAETEIIQDIEREIEEIKNIRSLYCLEEIWQEGRDQYDGIVEYKDYPWEHCSNLHIHITSMSVDVMKVKAKAQMFVSPAMLLKPLPNTNLTSDEIKQLFSDIKLKEEYLDYKMLSEIDIETKLDPILEDAINLGTGIAKIDYERRKEEFTDIEIYEGIKDITRYMIDFEEQKDSDIYRSNLRKLERNDTIEVYVDLEDYVSDNPRITHVKLENLYVRPDIPELNNQRIIAEKIEKKSWLEIWGLVESKFIDRAPIEKIISEDEEYYKRYYTLYECNYYYKYDDSGKAKRCLITYIEPENNGNKRVVRAITYPYTHREPNYVFYYIKRIKGLIYGEGIARRLKDSNKALNSLWNQSIDSGNIRNLPMFTAIKNTEFDPSIKGLGPGIIWWTKNKGEVDVLHAGGISGETLNLISRMERYSEWITGVTAYMTGRESSSDPNAPMGKAYLLMKESNLRINDAIKSLHKCNISLYRQIDKLIYQYARDNELPYFMQKDDILNKSTLNRKILGLKVQYVPQLSDITVNKELQKQMDMQFGQYLQSRPMIMANPTAERTILENLIRNQGGVWEKTITNILPPEQKQQEQPPMLTEGGGGANVQELMKIAGGMGGGSKLPTIPQEIAGAVTDAVPEGGLI